MNDFRFAIRQLPKNPGYTVHPPQCCYGGRAVAMLTLGIEVNSAVNARSQQFLELVNGQSCVARDLRHRVGVDWIVPGNLHGAHSVAQDDVFALANENESCLFQSAHGRKVPDAGKFRHVRSDADLFAINPGAKARFDLRLGFEVFLDGDANVSQGFLLRRTLAAAARQIVTPHGEAFFGLHQGHMILHGLKNIVRVSDFKLRKEVTSIRVNKTNRTNKISSTT